MNIEDRPLTPYPKIGISYPEFMRRTELMVKGAMVLL